MYFVLSEMHVCMYVCIRMYLVDDVSTITQNDRQTVLDLHHNFLSGIHRTEECEDDMETSVQLSAVSSLGSLQSATWDRVRIATSSDKHMIQLVDTIESGMPEFRHELPHLYIYVTNLGVIWLDPHNFLL